MPLETRKANFCFTLSIASRLLSSDFLFPPNSPLLTSRRTAASSPLQRNCMCPDDSHCSRVWIIITTDQQVMVEKILLSESTHVFCPGLAHAWIGAMVFESLVFILTLYRALTTKIRGLSVMYHIFRDGEYTPFFSISGGMKISDYTSFRNLIFRVSRSWEATDVYKITPFHSIRAVVLCSISVILSFYVGRDFLKAKKRSQSWLTMYGFSH